MTRKLEFQTLDSEVIEKGETTKKPTLVEKPAASPSWKRKRRETNPTVQMSVRMREDVYERFRAMCDEERRTNGDMLEHLMDAYEKALKAGVVSRF